MKPDHRIHQRFFVKFLLRKSEVMAFGHSEVWLLWCQVKLSLPAKLPQGLSLSQKTSLRKQLHLP